jgi:hypothetical protein
VVLRAFVDEMQSIEKSAGPISYFKNWANKLPQEIGTAADRLIHPIRGVREGWKELSGTAHAASLSPEEKANLVSRGSGHLFQPSVPLSQAARSPNRVSSVAEELSRRGWTGQGKITKYLPVGQKGLTVGLGGGFAVPSVYEAYKQGPVGPTGEGGLAERGLGELAGNAAFIAAGKMGIAPALAMHALGSGVAGKAGRVIDRLRGGASLRQALYAPSPVEAQEQIANIAENYSYGNA